MNSDIINQLFALIFEVVRQSWTRSGLSKSTICFNFWSSKTVLNTLWAFKQKACFDHILSLTKKKNLKLPVKLLSYAKQPWKSMHSFKSTFRTSCAAHKPNSKFRLLVTCRLTTYSIAISDSLEQSFNQYLLPPEIYFQKKFSEANLPCVMIKMFDELTCLIN